MMRDAERRKELNDLLSHVWVIKSKYVRKCTNKYPFFGLSFFRCLIALAPKCNLCFDSIRFDSSLISVCHFTLCIINRIANASIQHCIVIKWVAAYLKIHTLCNANGLTVLCILSLYFPVAQIEYKWSNRVLCFN